MTYENTIQTATNCLHHFVYHGTYETYLGEYIDCVAPADYEDAETAVGKLALDIISEALWDALPYEVRDDFELAYHHTYHPRYYNFETDSIVFDFNYSNELKDWMFDYVKDNDRFDKFLADNYTSRDGFISFTPNNWDDWLFSWRDSEYRCVSAALAFIIEEEISAESYEYDFNEKASTLITENYISSEYALEYESGHIAVCKGEWDDDKQATVYTAWLLDSNKNIVNTFTLEDDYDDNFHMSAYSAYEHGCLDWDLVKEHIENHHRYNAKPCDIPEWFEG